MSVCSGFPPWGDAVQRGLESAGGVDHGDAVVDDFGIRPDVAAGMSGVLADKDVGRCYNARVGAPGAGRRGYFRGPQIRFRRVEQVDAGAGEPVEALLVVAGVDFGAGLTQSSQQQHPVVGLCLGTVHQDILVGRFVPTFADDGNGVVNQPVKVAAAFSAQSTS